MSWTQDERTKFVTKICSFWGRWEPEEAWAFMEDLQRYPVHVVEQAVTQIWKTQERRFKPTVRRVFEELPTQVKTEPENTEPHGQVSTKSEIARNEAFWERLYDQAETMEHLERLKHIRQRMLKGMPLVAFGNL